MMSSSGRPCPSKELKVDCDAILAGGAAHTTTSLTARPPFLHGKKPAVWFSEGEGGCISLTVLKGRVEAHEGKELRSSLLGYRPFKPAVGFETQEVCAFLVVKGR